MIFLNILIFMIGFSIDSIKTHISPTLFLRICSLSFVYAAILAFNSLYVNSIVSGIGIYSGLFLVSSFSQTFDFLILITASL